MELHLNLRARLFAKDFKKDVVVCPDKFLNASRVQSIGLLDG